MCAQLCGIDGCPYGKPEHKRRAASVEPKRSLTALHCKCRLGRRILRPLLRSEVGEVANRRAWFDASKLTPEVLQLYKQPLKVQGWDLALLEVGPSPFCIFCFPLYIVWN